MIQVVISAYKEWDLDLLIRDRPWKEHSHGWTIARGSAETMN